MRRRRYEDIYSKIRNRTLKRYVYLKQELRKRNLQPLLMQPQELLAVIMDILEVSERCARDFMYALILDV